MVEVASSNLAGPTILQPRSSVGLERPLHMREVISSNLIGATKEPSFSWRTQCSVLLFRQELQTNKSNQKKKDQLGMSIGTAMGRLRKAVLFRLMQKYDEDTCYRCGQKIESVDELSFDHKEPWLDVSNELFWDLDNVAFSHLRCNRPHRLNKPLIGPKGTLWCSGCQDFVPKNRFGDSNYFSRGKRYYCNDCRKRSDWEHNARKKNRGEVR